MITFPKPLQNYLTRIDAEPLNYRRAVVKIHKGAYWQEKVLINILPTGDITTTLAEYAPTKEEQEDIKASFKDFKFPRTINTNNIDSLLPLLKGNQHFIFYDRSNATDPIIMVQERREFKTGKKAYIPWVFLSTGEWISMEPDNGLPFYKPQHATSSMIMIHEGAKAAQAAQHIANNPNSTHPWAEDLRPYEHWGLIGGALTPHRTNFKELRAASPSEVIYVADRDDDGQAVLQKVSELYGGSMTGIFFGEEFPAAFDMADPLPPHLFTKKKRYIGPSFKEMRKPATFATEMNPPTMVKGRPYPTIRSEFAKEWMHCITPAVFVHRAWPNRFYSSDEFNALIAPYSHIRDTASLLLKNDSSKASSLDYDPGKPHGIFPSQEGFVINTHCPSPIQPEVGDPQPFIDFLEYLIPSAHDRTELLRWCATLVCRPDIRMHYGILLISETQGVGKSTLAEKILSPLVGHFNVSYPNESDIVDSQFNDWVAHKRLAIIQEIYQGQSFKAYNRLKKYVTDEFITVNKKYAATYRIRSFMHFFACSNSKRALKLDDEDRRWFLPEITQVKRPQQYWDTFNLWLREDGGLSIIRHYLQEWLKKNEPVLTGTSAPHTAQKQEVIREGLSNSHEQVLLLLEQLKEKHNNEPFFLLDFDLVNYIKHKIYNGHQNNHLDKPATIRRLAKNHGFFVGTTRAQIKDWGPETYGARIIASTPELAEETPGTLHVIKHMKPVNPLEVL